MSSRTILKISRTWWFAPTVHVLLYAIAFLGTAIASKPLFDGPTSWLVNVLFVADFPFAMVAFAAMWSGKWTFGILLWGIGGTAWWCFLGWVIRLVCESIQTHKKVSLDT